MGTFVVQDLAGRRSVAAARQMTIGRSRQNDLVLEAPLASRRHAWAWRQGDQQIIEDLGSTHGTWVNGQRLAGPRFLQSGDVIQMGEARLVYQTEQDPSTIDTPRRGLARRSEQALYCARCGGTNAPGAEYCVHCGFPLEAQPWASSEGAFPATPGRAWEPPVPATAPRRPITPVEPPMIRPFPAVPATVPAKQARSSRVPILLMAIITVLLLVILGILIIFLLMSVNG